MVLNFTLFGSIYITYFYISFSSSNSVTEVQFGFAYYFIKNVVIEFLVGYLALY